MTVDQQHAQQDQHDYPPVQDVPKELRGLHMPSRYADWIEDVERVSNAYDVLIETHFALATAHRHRNDFSRCERMLEEVVRAAEGLEGFLVGYGLAEDTNGRKQQISDEWREVRAVWADQEDTAP